MTEVQQLGTDWYKCKGQSWLYWSDKGEAGLRIRTRFVRVAF